MDLMYRKKSPKIFLSAFQKALSYFPELHDTYIFIHEKSLFGVQHTLRAYPPFVVLHWKKQNWVYPIVINKNKSKNLSFYDLNYIEQIGLLTHELSHISKYITYSRRDIAKFSFQYATNKDYVRKIEEDTDKKVIERGGGLYLLAGRLSWLKFRLQNVYKETEDTYMLPDEFIDELKKFPNLYPNEVIENLVNNFEDLKKMPHYKLVVYGKISLSRRIKHGLKTVFSFIPEFFQMLYLIPIKKVHK